LRTTTARSKSRAPLCVRSGLAARPGLRAGLDRSLTARRQASEACWRLGLVEWPVADSGHPVRSRAAPTGPSSTTCGAIGRGRATTGGVTLPSEHGAATGWRPSDLVLRTANRPLEGDGEPGALQKEAQQASQDRDCAYRTGTHPVGMPIKKGKRAPYMCSMTLRGKCAPIVSMPDPPTMRFHGAHHGLSAQILDLRALYSYWASVRARDALQPWATRRSRSSSDSAHNKPHRKHSHTDGAAKCDNTASFGGWYASARSRKA